MERATTGSSGDRDRDLAALEQAEAELAELERELRRVEHADEPRDG